jgi:hypothetical protein
VGYGYGVSWIGQGDSTLEACPEILEREYIWEHRDAMASIHIHGRVMRQLGVH